MNGSAEVGIIVSAMNKMVETLSDRVIKTETDVADRIKTFGEDNRRHQKAVEDLLRQLVELTKEVAVMRKEADHRDDHIEELNEAIKRIHGKIDVSDKNHKELNDFVKKAFWVGTGMWILASGWFYIYNPVRSIENVATSITQLKEDVKDLREWQWKLQQDQHIDSRSKR